MAGPEGIFADENPGIVFVSFYSITYIIVQLALCQPITANWILDPKARCITTRLEDFQIYGGINTGSYLLRLSANWYAGAKKLKPLCRLEHLDRYSLGYSAHTHDMEDHPGVAHPDLPGRNSEPWLLVSSASRDDLRYEPRI